MLTEEDELKPVLYSPDLAKLKPYTCVRVDGASDEGPSHLEVQFMWAKFHLQMKDELTSVSTRCSGQNYLNIVELQNGCEVLGRSNLFIPSTSCGPNIKEGQFDTETHEQNMEAAIETYIEKVNVSHAVRQN